MAAIITDYQILSQPKYMTRLFCGWQWEYERQSEEVSLHLQFTNCENQILCRQNIKTIHRHLKDNYMIRDRIVQPRPGLVKESVNFPQYRYAHWGLSIFNPAGVRKYWKRLPMTNHKIACFWRVFEDNVFFAHEFDIAFGGTFFYV